MITLLCTLVVLCACTIGAVVGFGGGVIIKPILDSTGLFGIDTVNFISSCAVLAMSISTVLRHIKMKTKVDKGIVLWLSVGAVLGGFCGSRLFEFVLGALGNSATKSLQAGLIIAFVGAGLFVVNKKGIKTLRLTSGAPMLLSGLALGTLNSFIGIGGGPINIMVLLLFFSLAVKDGAVYSLAVVFFCQLSHLVTLFVQNQFQPYRDSLWIVLACMVASVAGGIMGGTLNKRLSQKSVRVAFDVVMIVVFCINAYNLFT